jgi:hypothetical protein
MTMATCHRFAKTQSVTAASVGCEEREKTGQVGALAHMF